MKAHNPTKLISVSCECVDDKLSLTSQKISVVYSFKYPLFDGCRGVGGRRRSVDRET